MILGHKFENSTNLFAKYNPTFTASSRLSNIVSQISICGHKRVNLPMLSSFNIPTKPVKMWLILQWKQECLYLYSAHWARVQGQVCINKCTAYHSMRIYISGYYLTRNYLDSCCNSSCYHDSWCDTYLGWMFSLNQWHLNTK